MRTAQERARGQLPHSSGYCLHCTSADTWVCLSHAVACLLQNFAKQEEVEKIIQTHSYFVPFPIYINNKQVNTVQAIWALQPNEVEEET